MKIVLIGPTYPFRGGIAHYTTLLYQHLKKRHDVRFFAFKRQYPVSLFPGASDSDPSEKMIDEPDAERIIDSLNPLTWIYTVRRIVREAPALVIFPWWVSFWAPQFYTIIKLIGFYCKSKILFICHNAVPHEASSIDKSITRLVLGQGDYFIVHSDEDGRNLKQLLPNALIKQNYHPTYDVFASIKHDSHAIRNRYGIAGPIILFFGFVREYKGLIYLLKALPEILKEIPITLIVAGEFWAHKKSYIDFIREAGIEKNVKLIDGYISNESVGMYFSAADLVVQPYVSATGSGVVQMAFGFLKPVVATRVGCLPEIVDDGQTGYLVDPKSPGQIAEAVIRFFKEQKGAEFSENIRRTNYRFSWDKMVDVIESTVSAK